MAECSSDYGKEVCLDDSYQEEETLEAGSPASNTISHQSVTQEVLMASEDPKVVLDIPICYSVVHKYYWIVYKVDPVYYVF